MAHEDGICRVCDCPCKTLKMLPSPRSESRETGRGSLPYFSNEATFYNCNQCGWYFVLLYDESDYLFDRQTGAQSKKHPGFRLSCMLRERYIRQKIPTFLRFGEHPSASEQLSFDLKYVSARCDEILNGFPVDAVEKIDRSLLNLSVLMGDRPGNQVTISNRNDRTVFYSDFNADVDYMLNSLADKPMGYIRHAQSNEIDCREVSITPAGWLRVRELTRSIGRRDEPVFVAMAFGRHGSAQETAFTKLFDEALKKAVEHCGYRVKRADSEPHNDYIMNKVIGDIRAAPFVVADFTRHRKGVYFEAGFARGLGKHVIHCCKRSEFRRAHFDTSQIAHILWDNETDLYSQLRHAIRAAIGTGPHKELMKDAPED